MNIKIDYDTHAKINPVFLTAKTAVSFMAQAGLPDSAEIVSALNLENNQMFQEMSDSDTIIGNALAVEAKYLTMCRLIENSGRHICVDLPCGYTPKAVHLTEKGIRFVGLDLPIVIKEFEPIIRSLADNQNLMSFYGVDATNYESLETALNDIDEPICITTEGMMMYFNEDEVNAVISNIRALLEIHGGCWITPDPEFKLQFILTFRSVFGESALENFMEKSGNTAMKQSDVANLSNSFILDATNISSSVKIAENLLKSHGLKVEYVNVAENMPNLNIYRKLKSEQVFRFKDAMKRCNYWIVTLDSKNKSAVKKSSPFEMNCKFENGILFIKFRGRIDSLSAPKILTVLENEKAIHFIDEVKIDCSEVEFISAAGYRVLSKIKETK